MVIFIGCGYYSVIVRLLKKSVTQVKWWKQKRGGGRCIKTGGAAPAKVPYFLHPLQLAHQELGLDNLGGIFVITFSGVALASVVCLMELLYVTYQESEELGTGWWYEIR